MEENILEILVEQLQNTDPVILIPIDRPTELSNTNFIEEVMYLVDILGLKADYRGVCPNTNYEKGRYDGHPDWVRHETALWPGAVGVHYTSYVVYFANETAQQKFINEINSHPEFGYKAKIPLEVGFFESISNIKKVDKLD